MPAGRPPIPVAKKKAMGYRADRIPGDAPMPSGPIGEAPDWLDDEGKAAWRRIVPKVSAMGVGTSADSELLALVCDHWSRMMKARESLATLGEFIVLESGGMKTNPASATLKHCTNFIARGLSSLGMTPVARNALHVATEPEADDLDEFRN